MFHWLPIRSLNIHSRKSLIQADTYLVTCRLVSHGYSEVANYRSSNDDGNVGDCGDSGNVGGAFNYKILRCVDVRGFTPQLLA